MPPDMTASTPFSRGLPWVSGTRVPGFLTSGGHAAAKALAAVKVQAVDDAGKPQADLPAKPLPDRLGWVAFKTSAPAAARYVIRW